PSVHSLERSRGMAGIFRSNKRGFDGLKLLVERLPEGRYADDAILAMADEYARKGDWAEAAKQYRNLLVRYPQSDLAPTARLKLGDAYLARDAGDPYHAGFVNVDPRSPASPQYESSRPIVSCVEAALEQYQAFVDEAPET